MGLARDCCAGGMPASPTNAWQILQQRIIGPNYSSTSALRSQLGVYMLLQDGVPVKLDIWGINP